MPNTNLPHRPFFISFLGWTHVLTGPFLIIGNLLHVSPVLIFSSFSSEPMEISLILSILFLLTMPVLLLVIGCGLLKLKKWAFYLELLLLVMGAFPLLLIQQNLISALGDIFRLPIVLFFIYKLFSYKSLFS